RSCEENLRVRAKMDRPLVRHLAGTLDGLEITRRTRNKHHSQEIPILLAELSRVPLHVAGLLESLQLFPLGLVKHASILGVVKAGRIRRSVFERNKPKLNDPLYVLWMFHRIQRRY